MENDGGSAELNPVKVQGAVQTPVAAELMWVADASIVYWCCLLAKTKFSNVQGVLRSAVFMLPALLHPPQTRVGGGQLMACKSAQGPVPYEINHFVEL